MIKSETAGSYLDEAGGTCKNQDNNVCFSDEEDVQRAIQQRNGVSGQLLEVWARDSQRALQIRAEKKQEGIVPPGTVLATTIANRY